MPENENTFCDRLQDFDNLLSPTVETQKKYFSRFLRKHIRGLVKIVNLGHHRPLSPTKLQTYHQKVHGGYHSLLLFELQLRWMQRFNSAQFKIFCSLTWFAHKIFWSFSISLNLGCQSRVLKRTTRDLNNWGLALGTLQQTAMKVSIMFKIFSSIFPSEKWI